MRQVTIDKLRKDLTQELNDLPFEIIKRNKIIAIVNLKVQENKQNNDTPNLKVQPNINSPKDVKNWHKEKFSKKGKFITYFK